MFVAYYFTSMLCRVGWISDILLIIGTILAVDLLWFVLCELNIAKRINKQKNKVLQWISHAPISL